MTSEIKKLDLDTKMSKRNILRDRYQEKDRKYLLSFFYGKEHKEDLIKEQRANNTAFATTTSRFL